MMGEYLPPYLVHQLHRQTRERLFDWAWQRIANSTVPVFESYKSRHG
jgi:hypothetical protein